MKRYNGFGNAFAGHYLRASDNPKAKKYDNDLTNFVDLMIAQIKAEKSITDDIQLQYVSLKI